MPVVDVPAPDPDECTHEVRLIGPKSPLETPVYGLMEAARTKKITIDGQSVNSVLLDNDPKVTKSISFALL